MSLGLGNDANIYNQIKEAVCILFRSQKFQNTTVIDLVEELQIDEQSFFMYFQSMDELMEVVWSES